MIKLAFRTCKQDFEDGFEEEEEVLIKAWIQSGEHAKGDCGNDK